MFPSNKKNWATWIACKYGWRDKVIMIIYEKSKKEKPQYGTNK
jgi:hypothetical protein